MEKTNNKNAKHYVLNFKNFKGSNLIGKNTNNAYVVLSYGYYPIFLYKDGIWYENDNSYSHSTKVHMAHTRPTSDTILLNTEELKELV